MIGFFDSLRLEVGATIHIDLSNGQTVAGKLLRADVFACGIVFERPLSEATVEQLTGREEPSTASIEVEPDRDVSYPDPFERKQHWLRGLMDLERRPQGK